MPKLNSLIEYAGLLPATFDPDAVISILEDMSRLDVIAFLQWNDPNGLFSDEHSEEFSAGPMTESGAKLLAMKVIYENSLPVKYFTETPLPITEQEEFLNADHWMLNENPVLICINNEQFENELTLNHEYFPLSCGWDSMNDEVSFEVENNYGLQETYSPLHFAPACTVVTEHRINRITNKSSTL